MQKHIYFLNENNTGALYGVGTYMNHLLQVLPPERFRITILYLYTHFEELTVKNNGNIRSIYFPEPPTRTKPVQYHRSIFYILFPYIEKEEENILHLNFRSCIDLVALLRQHFSFKVILTWHFFTGIDFASGRVFEQITEGKGEGDTVTFNRAYKETIRRESELMHRYCDKIVLVASHSYEPIRNIYRLPASKLEVIYNCLPDLPVSDSKAVLREAFHFSPEEKIILFAGRLDDNKNPALLIRSFHKIRSEYPASRLIIAGDGDYRTPLSLLHPDYAYITFVGFVDREKLYRLYSLADIGVIPSHYEEFGYVALEMMMQGLPVIANRTSGLAEVIEEGISGELLDLYTEEDEKIAADRLANALLSLLADPNRQAQYAKNGRKRYLENFGTESFKKKMCDLYDKLEETE